MLPPMDLTVLLLVGGCFVWQAFKYAQFQWLWFAVALWLVIGIFSAKLLPGVLGVTHIANVYPLHIYLFSGSIFFWMNSVHRLPESGCLKWRSDAGALLTLFALAALVMFVASAWLALLIGIGGKEGLASYMAGRLFSLLLFDPVSWYAMCAVLMGVFWQHRRLNGETAQIFSSKQLYAGLLLALLMQAAYCLTHVFWWLVWVIRMNLMN